MEAATRGNIVGRGVPSFPVCTSEDSRFRQIVGVRVGAIWVAAALCTVHGIVGVARCEGTPGSMRVPVVRRLGFGRLLETRVRAGLGVRTLDSSITSNFPGCREVNFREGKGSPKSIGEGKKCRNLIFAQSWQTILRGW